MAIEGRGSLMRTVAGPALRISFGADAWLARRWDARLVVGRRRAAGVPRSWRPCVTMFTDELPWLPERDKRLVMSEVVRAW